jgi:hypothetical protein
MPDDVPRNLGDLEVAVIHCGWLRKGGEGYAGLRRVKISWSPGGIHDKKRQSAGGGLPP